MKLYVSIILCYLCLANYSLSQGLGIGGGLSFWIGNDISKTSLKTIQQDKNPGFNLNARVKVGSSEYIKYTFNIGWNKFTIDKVTIQDPRSNDIYNLSLSQNIFPLSAGIQLGLPMEVLKLYISGDVVYNIIRNSIDFDKPIGGTSIGIPVMFGDKTTYRIGASPGIGAEIKLGILILDASVKLQYMNLINKDSDESTTSYLMTNISVFF
jgi:hypothetical protein